ncbi:hypothetical protein DSO57_1031368 [Entomophthora muscae]|uniref:Uncharacterized protein n=1 Tax=Entomophthora muscae TaxID=34485 RepID=A0ACC2T0R4_9FUNG|nr:hypothetical protein DSO57_1031368 [Entomophthora muscae]
MAIKNVSFHSEVNFKRFSPSKSIINECQPSIILTTALETPLKLVAWNPTPPKHASTLSKRLVKLMASFKLKTRPKHKLELPMFKEQITSHEFV